MYYQQEILRFLNKIKMNHIHIQGIQLLKYYIRDANNLMARLDSLREIKSADSPIISHVSPIPSTL